MTEFEFTPQGYLNAREYLKQIEQWEDVKIQLPQVVIRKANKIYFKNNKNKS